MVVQMFHFAFVSVFSILKFSLLSSFSHSLNLPSLSLFIISNSQLNQPVETAYQILNMRAFLWVKGFSFHIFEFYSQGNHEKVLKCFFIAENAYHTNNFA